MHILDKVKQAIKRHSMLSGGEKVLIGLSGGPDSVCLLQIMTELRSGLGIEISAIYIDHGLRPEEIPNEIALCKRLCKERGVDLITESIAVKSSPLVKEMGTQGAARELRYEAIQKVATAMGSDKIALGHHISDQVETFLINMIRGAGMSGLSGIPPCRDNIIRPLIGLHKEEIDEFLSSNKIEYIRDSSNLDEKYLRNRIRSLIIPELQKINPGLMDTISRNAEILRQENDHLEMITTKTLIRLFSRRSKERVELFLVPMISLPAVILRRALRRAIAEIVSLRSVSYQNIEDMIELVRSGETGGRLSLPCGVRVVREYSVLVITTERPQELKTYTLDINKDVVIEEAGIMVNAERSASPIEPGSRSRAVFDLTKLGLPLTIRRRNAGDFFYPYGFGRKKKIQDYFVDEKVPRDLRDSIPLICSGKDVIWVVGYRQDERFAPDKSTDKFLIITSRIINK